MTDQPAQTPSVAETTATSAHNVHWGLNKLYFACCTEPATPLAELEPHVEEHTRYLVGLEKQGSLFAAGPLLDQNDQYNGVGLIVLRATSRDEARALADSDPLHARGLRTYRLVPWQVNEGRFVVRVDYSDGTFQLE
jgi:uncharacterized protein YciI